MLIRVTHHPGSLRLYVGPFHVHHGVWVYPLTAAAVFPRPLPRHVRHVALAVGIGLALHDRKDFPFSPWL
jgi:hypothetical protein